MHAAAPTIIGWEMLKSAKFPDELYSLNEYTGGFGPFSRSSRRHWKDTRSWFMILRAQDGLGIPIPHGDQKRRVDIIRVIHAGQRAWDAENVYGGTVKSISDALVDLGWLKDDGPAWRELSLMQIKWADLGPVGIEGYKKRRFSTIVSVLKPVFEPEERPS